MIQIKSDPVPMPEGSLLLAGPTASGKSAVALELVRRLEGELVSLDSMQVYRGMDIGTAKPGAAARAQVPHHLVDLVSIREPFDAAKFLAAAHGIMQDLLGRGRPAVCVGGTGLYFNVLLQGLPKAPAPDPALRAELEALPLAELVAALAAEDPAAHASIDCANARRVIRALERVRLGGCGCEGDTRAWKETAPLHSRPVFGLRRHPEDLRRRIDRRVEAMFGSGLVEEVQHLLAAGLAGNRTALQALGYRQVVEYLKGERGLEETILRVKQKTWQYARRQRTWFQRQLNVIWLEVGPDEPPAVTSERILESKPRRL